MNLAAYSKAIVAAVMAVVGIANVFLGTNWDVQEEVVTALVTSAISLATPFLVYSVPNKGK